jgi:hypothetical protein
MHFSSPVLAILPTSIVSTDIDYFVKNTKFKFHNLKFLVPGKRLERIEKFQPKRV